jgi:hypothetical protein
MNDMSIRRGGKEMTLPSDNNFLTNEAVALLGQQIKPKGPYLLGIDWCHIQRTSRVIEKGTGDPHPDGWYVRENTGMAGVIPAWKIAELLDCGEFKSMRKEHEDKLIEARNQVSLDDASREDVSDEVFTKADFETALKKVSRKIEPET